MRAYYIFQFNIRHRDGRPMEGDHTAVIKENDRFTWKGEAWWHEGGMHQPGDDPCAELDCNIECEVQNGTPEPTEGLMDQLAYSYEEVEFTGCNLEDSDEYVMAAAKMLLERYGSELNPCVVCGLPYQRGRICTHCGETSPHVPKD